MLHVGLFLPGGWDWTSAHFFKKKKSFCKVVKLGDALSSFPKRIWKRIFETCAKKLLSKTPHVFETALDFFCYNDDFKFNIHILTFFFDTHHPGIGLRRTVDSPSLSWAWRVVTWTTSGLVWGSLSSIAECHGDTQRCFLEEERAEEIANIDLLLILTVCSSLLSLEVTVYVHVMCVYICIRVFKKYTYILNTKMIWI